MSPALLVCVRACAANTEFVSNWLRLRHNLPKSAIEQMVDDATGRNDAIAKQFIADVQDLVLDRLPQ
jgi:hypothetical protein